MRSKYQSISFSIDSNYFAAIGDSGTHFNIYSCSSYKMIESIFVPNSQIDKLVFTPLNELFVLCNNCALKIYKV